MATVSSRAIGGVTYDDKTRLMIVQFRDGSAYSYSMVPSATHRALMAAESKGNYFNQYIKGRYAEQRVK